MRKTLYTLDEADAIWTQAIDRGERQLRRALSHHQTPSLHSLTYETSTITR
jgi:hypothetical protein